MAGLYSALRPVLFRLEPEQAHSLVAGSLKLLQSSGALGLLRSETPEFPVTFAGMRLRNPVGIAAGFDKDAELAPALTALGFGFIEVGTLTRRPQSGNPRPRVFRYPDLGAIVNRLGFNNCGVEEAARRLERAPREVPIGVNIGKSAATPLEDAPREYAECAAIAAPVADYLVANISSPNTAELRRLHEPDRLRALAEAVAARRAGKPLFLKVSPDLSEAELDAVAKVALEFGVGLVATNTTVDREGLSGVEPGGLSGRPLKSKALAALRRLRQATAGKVPLIGVGGIFDAADARDRMQAGADAVQVYTGFIYKGPGLVAEIVRGLS